MFCIVKKSTKSAAILSRVVQYFWYPSVFSASVHVLKPYMKDIQEAHH